MMDLQWQEVKFATYQTVMLGPGYGKPHVLQMRQQTFKTERICGEVVSVQDGWTDWVTVGVVGL